MDLLHNMSANQALQMYKVLLKYLKLERTRFCDKQTYEQTGGCMGKHNMSLNTDVGDIVMMKVP